MNHKPLPIGIDNKALRQIDERDYARELEDDGYAMVYRYGIAFCGKDCVVKLAQDN